MIYFCEECGEQISPPPTTGNAKQVVLTCGGCNDSVIVPLNNTAGLRQSTPVMTNAPDSRLKVLVVDDSKFIRRVIREIINTDGSLQVVGEAENGAHALELIPQLDPDVITLDINMPVMDGLTTLKHIMVRFPRPTVMFSSLTKEGASTSFDALKYGAVDFLEKPSQMRDEDQENQQASIIDKIKMAAGVRLGSIRLIRRQNPQKGKASVSAESIDTIYAIGAAEGGYASLLQFLPQLKPGSRAAYVVVLYATAAHLHAFTDYLNNLCSIEVRRAEHGGSIRAGACYITAGNEYVTLEPNENSITLSVTPSPFPERRGAINMLMVSLSEMTQVAKTGVILAGDGDDGVEGLLEIEKTGGTAFIQNPETCLFKNMAMLAHQRCAAATVASPSEMATAFNHAPDNT